MQINTLRLNWYGLNYSTIDRRDFYVFSNLSEILIEPSNTTGFSTRTIREEEYENPKLWATYEAVGVFGRVLNVRLFSSFMKESCCSKWLSRFVLAHLLSSEATASWFKHCFRGFNLFCQENMNKPPKWMIMAWIQSLDEFKDLMENYCEMRKTARFKKNIIKAFWNQEETENKNKSLEDVESVKTIYKYENQGSQEVLNRVVKDQLTPKQDTEALTANGFKPEFYKKLAASLLALNFLCLVILSGTCCLYCRAKGALELAGKYGSTLTQYRGSTLKNASLNRKESTQSLEELDKEKHLVSNHLNTNQTITSNNNNYLSKKSPSKETSSTKDTKEKADGTKKFVKRLRTILGLKPSNSLDSHSEERERLVPRGSDNGDQNNNNTTNLNSSNSATDDLTNLGNAGHPTLESDANESLDLSDEEELEQIFLDHLYNRMRAQSRYDYLTQFDKYGYCDHKDSGELFK